MGHRCSRMQRMPESNILFCCVTQHTQRGHAGVGEHVSNCTSKFHTIVVLATHRWVWCALVGPDSLLGVCLKHTVTTKVHGSWMHALQDQATCISRIQCHLQIVHAAVQPSQTFSRSAMIYLLCAHYALTGQIISRFHLQLSHTLVIARNQRADSEKHTRRPSCCCCPHSGTKATVRVVKGCTHH